MLLQFCDKCGKPLSEGCLARGEAVERGGELICASCDAATPSMPAPQGNTGPLGHYETAVWRCTECGIPVTALDLIEGRAARAGDTVTCARCKPAGSAVSHLTSSRASRPAPVVPRPNSTPRHTRAAAESYVTQARHEQRRPVLPIVLFSIVFAGFAASLFFAITSQRKLEQAMNAQGREVATDPRDSRPRERLNPEQAAGDNAASDAQADPPMSPNPQPADDESAPPVQATPKRVPVPPEVMGELVEIERGLAAPVNEMLASSDLGEVLEGLIIAGSRRLIACRGHVRALLRESDDQIRAAACRVAAMLNDAEALPTLTRMAERDPNEAVKVEARKAKDRMTGQATREVRDLTDEEIDEMLKDLKRELERRRGRDE